jgi:hypothetical protein
MKKAVFIASSERSQNTPGLLDWRAGWRDLARRPGGPWKAAVERGSLPLFLPLAVRCHVDMFIVSFRSLVRPKATVAAAAASAPIVSRQVSSVSPLRKREKVI